MKTTQSGPNLTKPRFLFQKAFCQWFQQKEGMFWYGSDQNCLGPLISGWCKSVWGNKVLWGVGEVLNFQPSSSKCWKRCHFHGRLIQSLLLLMLQAHVGNVQTQWKFSNLNGDFWGWVFNKLVCLMLVCGGGGWIPASRNYVIELLHKIGEPTAWALKVLFHMSYSLTLTCVKKMLETL